MSMKEPRVSVIIPIPPGGEADVSLASVRRQKYDRKKIEVLLTIGRHRSIQRNDAIQKATGEILFFLDNDVHIPYTDYIRRHVDHYKANTDVVSVGGPSLTNESDTPVQHAIGHVLASYFATQVVRARYARIGRTRATGEAELILCNQSMRTNPVRAVGMFDSRFHSGNEENELINRLGAAGYTLLHDPDLFVYRSQRPTLFAFGQQIAKYGKSRIDHFLAKPSSFEAKFLVPLGFLAYLILLPAALWFAPTPILRLAAAAPAAAYVLSAALFSISAFRLSGFRIGLITLLLFPVHHLSYAVGNLIGVYRWFRPLKRIAHPTVVKKVKL